jgi:hypothetical protein
MGPVMWVLLFGFGADPTHGPITSFRNSARSPLRDVRLVDWAVLCVVTLAYVGIHLIGWKFVFPITVE